jgi:hypothetical protein
MRRCQYVGKPLTGHYMSFAFQYYTPLGYRYQKSCISKTHLYNWHYFTCWLESLAVFRLGVEGGERWGTICDSVLFRSYILPWQSRPGRYFLSLLAAWAFSDYCLQVFSLYIYTTAPTCKSFCEAVGYVQGAAYIKLLILLYSCLFPPSWFKNVFVFIHLCYLLTYFIASVSNFTFYKQISEILWINRHN